VAERTLTLALHGEVTLEAFADAIQHWRGVVDALTLEAAPGRDVRWVISDLIASSAIATVRAEGEVEAAAPVEESYLELGRALAAGNVQMYPEPVRFDALRLTGLIDGSVDFIRFETAQADAIITTNYDRLLEAAVPQIRKIAQTPAALGGVRGRVQTLQSRGGLRFTLYDTLFDKAVSCYLHEGQEEIMRDVWGQAAVVEGVVTRDPMTGRPLTIRDVRNVSAVREVAPDAYLQARGAIPREVNDRREPEDLIELARAYDHDDLIRLG
jgi:hypothetical protein